MCIASSVLLGHWRFNIVVLQCIRTPTDSHCTHCVGSLRRNDLRPNVRHSPHGRFKQTKIQMWATNALVSGSFFLPNHHEFDVKCFVYDYCMGNIQWAGSVCSVCVCVVYKTEQMLQTTTNNSARIQKHTTNEFLIHKRRRIYADDAHGSTQRPQQTAHDTFFFSSR